MSAFETVRLVGEIVAVILVAGSGFVGLAKLILRSIDEQRETRAEVQGVNTRLDTLNGKVSRHDDELAEQRELNAWFAGKIGEPLPKRKG